jgi:hypothetical protein
MPADDSWVARQFADLQRQITELRAAQTLNAATIGSGGLTINQDGSLQVVDQASGRQVVYIGETVIPDGSGRRQMVAYFTRDDGNVALVLGDAGSVPGHVHQQSLQWFDRVGNVVMADDTVSAVGLARPYIPAGTFVDITSPSATTTSTSFVGLQWADCFQQHPKVTASVLVQTGAGTTGQVRLTLGGVQIGAALTVPAATFSQLTIVAAPWPTGSYLFSQRVTVQLEGKVTGGTGSIGVRGLGFWGVQS